MKKEAYIALAIRVQGFLLHGVNASAERRHDLARIAREAINSGKLPEGFAALAAHAIACDAPGALCQETIDGLAAARDRVIEIHKPVMDEDGNPKYYYQTGQYA